LSLLLALTGSTSIEGSSARTLANFTSTASGVQTNRGSSSRILANFTSSASGSQTIIGSSARTLDNFISTASGSGGSGTARLPKKIRPDVRYLKRY